MIKSMTGFGLVIKEKEEYKICAEIKSLNSKFLELNLKLPRAFADKELSFRNDCNRLLERGKATVTIGIDSLDGIKTSLGLNHDLVKRYYHDLKNLSVELGDTNGNIFQLALKMPDVFQNGEIAPDETKWKEALEVFQLALIEFNKFRMDEGAVLAAEFTNRINNILSLLKNVEQFESNRITSIKSKIQTLLAETVGTENVDSNRLEQELIFYIEKLDITEEKIRLKSHCDYFLEGMNDLESNGKKLGFIAQEIGREINTLGSKANQADMQKLVVNMKDELEKIKEQLLNIL